MYNVNIKTFILFYFIRINKIIIICFLFYKKDFFLKIFFIKLVIIFLLIFLVV